MTIKGKNRVFVQAGDAGNGANAHSFQHHKKDFLGLLDGRVMSSERSAFFAECCTAIAALVTLGLVAIEAGFLELGVTCGMSWAFSS